MTYSWYSFGNKVYLITDRSFEKSGNGDWDVIQGTPNLDNNFYWKKEGDVSAALHSWNGQSYDNSIISQEFGAIKDIDIRDIKLTTWAKSGGQETIRVFVYYDDESYTWQDLSIDDDPIEIEFTNWNLNKKPYMVRFRTEDMETGLPTIIDDVKLLVLAEENPSATIDESGCYAYMDGTQMRIKAKWQAGSVGYYRVKILELKYPDMLYQTTKIFDDVLRTSNGWVEYDEPAISNLSQACSDKIKMRVIVERPDDHDNLDIYSSSVWVYYNPIGVLVSSWIGATSQVQSHMHYSTTNGYYKRKIRYKRSGGSWIQKYYDSSEVGHSCNNQHVFNLDLYTRPTYGEYVTVEWTLYDRYDNQLDQREKTEWISGSSPPCPPICP